MTARKWETTLASGRQMTLWAEEADGLPVRISVEAGKVGDPFAIVAALIGQALSRGMARGLRPDKILHTFSGRSGDEGSEAVDWIARTLGEHYGG